MLAAIGVKTIEDLFADVPAGVRFPELNLPGPQSEMETLRELMNLGEANADTKHCAIFVVAGAYNHYSTSVVNHMILRGEFLTAYTPYQPEISQGTLQAIFEYQSMVSQLTGMEVANASHYDGSTSLAEAAIMAYSHAREKCHKVIVSPAVHPMYRAVLRTYSQGMGLTITGDEDLKAGIPALARGLDADTALFVVQSPNFFGQLENLQGLALQVHAAGALLAVVADPVSLGLLKPPGQFGADIVVGEGQALGIPLQFGGPYLGFFATKK